jgi:GH15 family glucan-1,4-alpha-glucosidase
VTSIGDYGLIGDTRTAALVSARGSIDWMCFPRFDSPPLFGRLVGGDRAGAFELEVEQTRDTRRRYLDGSAVLETTWTTASGEVVLTDGMVADTTDRLLSQALVVRALSCRRGTVRGRVRFDPRRDWGNEPERADRRHGRLVCTWGSIVATLGSAPDLALAPGRTAIFELRSGESLILALGLDHREPAVLVDPRSALRELRRSDAWWRRWSAGLTPPAAGTDEAVRRSLITLRLLTYAPSGAPVAAPTTSLPEVRGGSDNWDYRFAWIRDASMGTSAFLQCGSRDEPRAFLWWMLHASRRTRPRLNVVYDVLGGSGLTERDRPELPGYRGARPVRVGNAAAEQFQLDAYAWMIDAGSAFLRATGELYAETWRSLRGHADVLAERWSEPDSGIWEVRGQPHNYVHSKLMAWLGLDRALGIGDRLGVRPRRRARWEAARGRIEQEVVRRGFDEALGSYVRSYGSSELDAATLAVAYGGLEDAGSPRVLRTIRAVRERLGAGGPLLYRFGPGAEGAFVPCSFWLSRALAATGSVDDARESFERTCALATDLGLFAEEIDPTTHEHVGNFPQAFCHAALVEAAAELGQAELVRASGTLRGSLRT